MLIGYGYCGDTLKEMRVSHLDHDPLRYYFRSEVSFSPYLSRLFV